MIKEAMRVHPGIGFPPERCVPRESAVICGTLLPASTNISMSAPTVHQDKSIFGEEADQFRPERWLEATTEEVKKMMDRSFLSVCNRKSSQRRHLLRDQCYKCSTPDLRELIVWIWCANLYWQKHLYNGDWQDLSSDSAPFRHRIGIKFSKVEITWLMVLEVIRYGGQIQKPME